MQNKIDINASEFVIGESPQILATAGIGSCVAICLFEKSQKVGALLHIMLPTATNFDLNPFRFADRGISLVFEKLQKKYGLAPEKFEAKIVGGAHMFHSVGPMMDLGANNVLKVEEILKSFGVSIVGRDVGGQNGRSVEFDLESGLVKISSHSVQ